MYVQQLMHGQQTEISYISTLLTVKTDCSVILEPMFSKYAKMNKVSAATKPATIYARTTKMQHQYIHTIQRCTHRQETKISSTRTLLTVKIEVLCRVGSDVQQDDEYEQRESRGESEGNLHKEGKDTLVLRNTYSSCVRMYTNRHTH